MSNRAFDNADRIQGVLSDNLFPEVQHISDVKQVLDFMSDYAAPHSEDQIRALILLEQMGNNERLHGKDNPYKHIIKQIKGEFKKSVALPETFLRTIEELIPKPPKPIIMADGRQVRGK